jgi:hypothetical protein
MEENNNEKKKKEKFPLKKEDKITPLDRSQINELLSESIQNYVSKIKKDVKDVENSMELINNYVSEFLQTFLIIGYDMKGQPLCIHHATTQMDADAINSLINRIIFNRNND